jgi:outer membrane protein TolC
VDESYWRIISIKEKVKLAEQYQGMLKKLLFDLENYQKEGIVIDNDLLKVRVKVNETELSLLKANNGLTLSKMALCQMIGLPLDALIDLNDSLLSSDIRMNQEDLTGEALNNRAEMSILKNNLSLADAGVNIMKSRFLPDIGLTANYGWMNPSPYSGFSKEFEGDFNVGIACKIPLWHWGERIHTLHAAQHEKKVSELKLDETREMISLQIRQAQYQYMESLKKIELTERSLNQAKENLRVTDDKFSEGMIKTSDVLEAQTMWQKAYMENIDALTELKINDTYLKKTSGELQKENK